MTVIELGRLRGISGASAARLARRHNWPRQKDNLTGTTRVLVPSHMLDRTDSPSVVQADTVRTLQNAINALEAAVAAFRERSEADAAMIAQLQAEIAGLRAELSEAREAARTAVAKAIQEVAAQVFGSTKAETEAGNERQDHPERAARTWRDRIGSMALMVQGFVAILGIILGLMAAKDWAAQQPRDEFGLIMFFAAIILVALAAGTRLLLAELLVKWDKRAKLKE